MVKVLETSVGGRVAAKPLFGVADVVYTWSDVVDYARRRGVWDEIADQTRAGIAALQKAEPTDEDVAVVARSFRYERGLLAGDDLNAWLDSRGLTTDEWQDYLRRVVACDLVGDSAAGAEIASARVEECIWAEGICSGSLETVARDLARVVAVAPDASPDLRDRAYESFCRDAAGEAAIEREVEANRLDWTRLRYDAVRFDDEDSAAEAILCVREDGDTIAEVAARIGIEVASCLEWLDEVAPELAAKALAADAGELLGPVAADGGFLLCWLEEKTPPSLADQDVRERARDAVVARAVASRLNDRVVWLERL
jgi:hypothetical protein